MLKFIMTLIVSLFTVSTYAATATSYKNDPLNFTLIVPAMEDSIVIICDFQDTCLDFNLVKKDNETFYYEEANGLCEIEIRHFSQDFGAGKTNNDFILTLSAAIIQVTKNEDQCQLQQELPYQKRSLTGIYNL